MQYVQEYASAVLPVSIQLRYHSYSYSSTVLLLDKIEYDNYLDPDLSEQLGIHVMSALKLMNINEKNTIHNKITDMMYKSIDFHPRFVIRYLREYESMIPEVMLCYDYKLSFNFIHSVSSHLKNYSQYETLLKKLFYSHNVKINFTANEVNQYMKYDFLNKYIVEKLICDQCVIIDQNFIDNIIEKHSFDLLVHIAPFLNDLFVQESLVSACRSSLDRYNKIEFLLDNKTAISKKAFDTVIDQIPNKMIKYYIDNTSQMISSSNKKINPNPSEKLICIKDKLGKKYYVNPKNYQLSPSLALHLLLAYGYPITNDEIYHALSRGVIIPNMNEYDVKHDVRYLHICTLLNIDPPYDIPYLFPDDTCLNNAVHNVNFSSIKNFIKINEIKPTTKTLHYICGKYRKYVKILEFLITHGAMVDFQCLKIFSHATIIHAKEKVKINNLIENLESMYPDPESVKSMNQCFDTLCRFPCFSNIRFGSILFRELKINFTKKLIPINVSVNDTLSNHNLDNNNYDSDSDSDSECINQISQHYSEIKLNESIFNMIPKNIKHILGITDQDQDRYIDFVEFRRRVIEYHIKMDYIDKKSHNIIPQKLFTKTRFQQVNLSNINDWIIGMLQSD